jgi:sensor domain CHASE-containing protein
MVLTSVSLISANQDVVACELEGDSVLLDIASSRYFRLNAVGTHVWNALTEPKTVADLQHMILEAFDVDAGRCAQDLDALLGKLSKSGLVEISNEPTPQ